MQPSPRPSRGILFLLAVATLAAGCKTKSGPQSEPGSGTEPRTETEPATENPPAQFDIELARPGDSAFTTASDENRIRLRAKLPIGYESAEVIWRVEQGTGDGWVSVTVPEGRETEIVVTSPTETTRYQGVHPNTPALRAERLERQRLQYRVSAVARRGSLTAQSHTLTIPQSMRAAIRQEYLDLGLRHGAPPLQWFTEVGRLPQGLIHGDFEVAVAEPEFMQRLAKLEQIWKTEIGLRWQLNGLFRNPVHNRFHVRGGGSGTVSNSWHQFGCAADLQTFPALTGGRATQLDSINARQFWDALAEESRRLDFDVEPRDKNPSRPGAAYSGVGHIHIETDCLP